MVYSSNFYWGEFSTKWVKVLIHNKRIIGTNIFFVLFFLPNIQPVFRTHKLEKPVFRTHKLENIHFLSFVNRLFSGFFCTLIVLHCSS